MSDMAPTQMNAPSKRPDIPHQKRKHGSPWYTVTLTVWLLFLSVIVAAGVIEYRQTRQALREQAESLEPQEASLGMSVLSERVEGIARQLQTESSGLRESMQSGLDTARHALEEGLTSVSEKLTAQADEAAVETATLKEQFKALEARLAERPTVISMQPETTRPQPAARPLPSIKAPFQVIGVEQRGFERFLTVMRSGSQSVADIQLLRVGTRFGSWLLEGIEEGHAVFRVEDAIVRLPIPRLPVSEGGF